MPCKEEDGEANQTNDNNNTCLKIFREMKTKWIIWAIALLPFVSRVQAAEQPVVLETPTGKIYGTLSIPDTGSSHPLVIIISGSGPTDRDGNQPMMGNNSLKMLADSLSNRGVASLRYDKRLIGESRTGQTEEEIRFENYVNDARAWVDRMASDPRFSKILFAGHSEGSLIALAASVNNPKIGGVISLNGMGRSADVVLKEQLAQIPEALREQAYAVIDTLKAGHEVSDTPAELGMLFRPSVQPYLISWFVYDPAPVIAELTVPVLVLQGNMDIQVTEEDARLLAQARPDARLEIIPGMNHILKDCSTRDPRQQMAVYTSPAIPLNGQITGLCVDFIRKIST